MPITSPRGPIDVCDTPSLHGGTRMGELELGKTVTSNATPDVDGTLTFLLVCVYACVRTLPLLLIEPPVFRPATQSSEPNLQVTKKRKDNGQLNPLYDYLEIMGMLNAAKSARAASAIAMYGRFEEAEADEYGGSAVRLVGEGGVYMVNGTYPIDLRPCTLKEMSEVRSMDVGR